MTDEILTAKIGRVSLEGFTTSELIEELQKRDDVIVYPRWVTSDDVFGHRETFPGDRILLMVKKE